MYVGGERDLEKCSFCPLISGPSSLLCFPSFPAHHPGFSSPPVLSAGLCSHAATGDGKSPCSGVGPTWGDVGQAGKPSSLRHPLWVAKLPHTLCFAHFPNSDTAFLTLFLDSGIFSGGRTSPDIFPIRSVSHAPHLADSFHSISSPSCCSVSISVKSVGLGGSSSSPRM